MPTADVLDCFERYTGYFQGLSEAEADAPDLLGRFKGALLRALQRVDDLPREDLVWRYLAVKTVNSKRLVEHSLRLLRHHPLDKDALWSLIADHLCGGSSCFPHEYWQQLLVAEESFDLRWPIFAGIRWILVLGDESAAELSVFLTRNGLWEEASPILQSLKEGEHEYARRVLGEFYLRDSVIEWAQWVLNRRPKQA
jgi:hypothetical protein